MVDEPHTLTLSDSASAQARRSFPVVAAVLFAGLPFAQIEHVGATAIPGCLTKGDLDVLVRVDAPDFQRAAVALDGLGLASSTRNERTDDYAEYDYSAGGVRASVQLVAAGSDLDDHFHRLKAILRARPEALAAYNALKTQHEGRSMSGYREAKGRLIDSLLARYPRGGVPDDSPLAPGIHE